jgi:hypothetical protein
VRADSRSLEHPKSSLLMVMPSKQRKGMAFRTITLIVNIEYLSQRSLFPRHSGRETRSCLFGAEMSYFQNWLKLLAIVSG